MNKSTLVSVADLVRVIEKSPGALSRIAPHLHYQEDDARRTVGAEHAALVQHRGADAALPEGHPRTEPAVSGSYEPVYWCISSVQPAAVPGDTTEAKGTDTSLGIAAEKRVEKQDLEHLPLFSEDQLLKHFQVLDRHGRPGKRVDEPRLIRRLSQGKALRRLPRRQTNHAPEESIILLDKSMYLQPLVQDFESVVRTIVRSQGTDLTRLVTLLDGPDGLWSERRGNRFELCPELTHQATVYLVSDFGEGAPGAHSRQAQWSQLVTGLSRAGHRITKVSLLDKAVNPVAVEALVGTLACLLVPSPCRLRHVRRGLESAGVPCSVTDELAAWNHAERDWRYSRQWMMTRGKRALWQRHFQELPEAVRRNLHEVMIKTRSSISHEAACIEWLVDYTLGLTTLQPPTVWLNRPIEAMTSDTSARAAVNRWICATNELLATTAHTFSGNARFAPLFAMNAEVAQRYDLPPAAGLDHVKESRKSAALFFYQQGEQLRVSEHPDGRMLLMQLQMPCMTVTNGRLITSKQVFNTQRVTVRTRTQEMTFEAVRKPSWADSISWIEEYVQAEHCSELKFRYIARKLPDQRKNSNGGDFVAHEMSVDSTNRGGLWVVNGNLPKWMQAAGVDACGLWADFQVGLATQRLRWIPPGEFLMGSPEDEPERGDNELLHRVTLTQGYWLAETACTQALWEAVMGSNPSRFKGSDRPVENVSWDEVTRFIDQLNSKLPGLPCRLPTEAEWEYAARAGSQTPFWWGSTLSAEQANYNGDNPYDDGEKGRFRDETIPVKEFEPNPWGLYQVHGNVLEWCEDWSGAYEQEAVVNPQGAESGERRVCRGGSWRCNGGGLRAAFGDRNEPGFRDLILGFRLSAGQSGAEPR